LQEVYDEEDRLGRPHRLFGAGIAVSGMIDPAKVLNFFDFAGTWDASLALVMAGALLVTAPGYRLVLRRRAPLFDPQYHIPAARRIDSPLLLGAAVFGIGWASPASIRAAPFRRLAWRSRPSSPSLPPWPPASSSPARPAAGLPAPSTPNLRSTRSPLK
jgi:hypothetical protein